MSPPSIPLGTKHNLTDLLTQFPFPVWLSVSCCCCCCFFLGLKNFERLLAWNIWNSKGNHCSHWDSVLHIMLTWPQACPAENVFTFCRHHTSHEILLGDIACFIKIAKKAEISGTYHLLLLLKLKFVKRETRISSDPCSREVKACVFININIILLISLEAIYFSIYY